MTVEGQSNSTWQLYQLYQRYYVPPYTVFDVGGNNYCLGVIVRYRFKKVFVQNVMTHREYDDWNKLYRKGKV